MFPKNKKRKTKKTDYQKAKDRAWRAFSNYIRHKECMETMGTFEVGKCCTCGSIKPYSALDSGHYISGRSNSVLFDETGVHIQCRYCNRFREGRKDEYETYMINRYGTESVERMKALKWLKTSLDIFSLTVIEKDYKEKLEILKGQL